MRAQIRKRMKGTIPQPSVSLGQPTPQRGRVPAGHNSWRNQAIALIENWPTAASLNNVVKVQFDLHVHSHCGGQAIVGAAF